MSIVLRACWNYTRKLAGIHFGEYIQKDMIRVEFLLALSIVGKCLPIGRIRFEVQSATCPTLPMRIRFGPRLTFRIGDIHVSHLSREKTILLTRAYEERAKLIASELPARNVCLSAVVPALAEPDIH